MDLLEEAFRKFAARDSAVCKNSRVTFRKIDEMSSALGAWLQSKGLAKGKRAAKARLNANHCMSTIV